MEWVLRPPGNSQHGGPVVGEVLFSHLGRLALPFLQQVHLIGLIGLIGLYKEEDIQPFALSLPG